jgi:Ca2+/Na+ antiporter
MLVSGICMLMALLLIYFFLRRRNVLYRAEGFALLGVYVLFLVLQQALL